RSPAPASHPRPVRWSAEASRRASISGRTFDSRRPSRRRLAHRREESRQECAPSTVDLSNSIELDRAPFTSPREGFHVTTLRERAAPLQPSLPVEHSALDDFHSTTQFLGVRRCTFAVSRYRGFLNYPFASGVKPAPSE